MSDFKHMFAKASFITFFNGTSAAEDRVAMNKSLKDAVEEFYQLLTTCFFHFSGSTSGYGGDGIYSMGLNEWSEFTIATGVINDDAKAERGQFTPQLSLSSTDVSFTTK